MDVFDSNWNPAGDKAQQRRAAMLERIAELRALEDRATHKSARAAPRFRKRGQLLPRERVALLLDTGAPWLPLMSLAGFKCDTPDADKSVPGGGDIGGIGFVSGVRCMVVANDSGIDAGALQPMGLEKALRLQDIALQERLPFIHLVESAGANLMHYKVDTFVHGGALFRNLARLSAAGLPVITVQHGSGTAGGAYMPGLSDIVILVEGRSRAFLAGPPLLKAATGEVATAEELGGAQMHATVSGLGEYLARDDREALGICRRVVAELQWSGRASDDGLDEPPWPAEELLGLMPATHREPVDMREVAARLVDGGRLLEFKPGYGAATVCLQARIGGHAVGLITNNGPIDINGANRATHFIQWLCQLGHPIIYLQNTTGYMVGKAMEQGGIIKHGSRMIKAVTGATVPQITVQCGASFGAGNYGMCGRAYAPRFLFTWPNAATAVMGGEQAARTMEIVATEAFKRKGVDVDPAVLKQQHDAVVATFERQQDAFTTSGLLLDDGVIDPRDTRAVLRFCLDTIAEGAARKVNPLPFGVERM
ncbi:MAG: acyl-CoA carboxylase subunit beta [Nevskiaceae bacterium]|nr:MAG: acyl-CoA carboxylase subunit beta [Nevskiaceae bacterium]TBR74288.1 MAG: acyl-CoA carboxylase subunit beta [Nevskiaceae bacterium]